MRMFRAIVLVTVLGASPLSCSSSSNMPVGLPDAETGSDDQIGLEVRDWKFIPDEVGLEPADMGAEVFEMMADIEPEFQGPDCAPGEGCYLDKCTENSQCQSGWCVEHMGEGVCSSLCQDECPAGWACKQVGVSDPDVVYICVSQHANLCRPCVGSADCQSAGGAQDVCVDYGQEGSFCGGLCDEDHPCPWGFGCIETETVDGVVLEQCVAEAGVCPCTATSVALGLWTPCEVVNDFGLCQGKRVCMEGGLGTCDAQSAALEACNGMDDDCDGLTDEPVEDEGDFINLCDDGNPCTEDNCMGVDACEYVVLDEGECMDLDACTVGDHCAAGECIGTPILCDDENPCTDDSCDGLGGCSFEHNANDCDDGDPCTVADQCQQSECSGVVIACDCWADDDCQQLEDNDQCNGTLFCDTAALPYKCAVQPDTVVECPSPDGPASICLKAHCDPTTGQCGMVADHSGFACDDGDVCTIGDKCQDGACQAGVPASCNDGNLCTDDSCDAVAGCQFTANSQICDDGNECTIGDHCQDGQCVETGLLDCDDGNPCTADSCLADSGCGHDNVEAPCSDGNPCTANDQCAAGQCQSGALVDCDDGNQCTVDSCGDAGVCLHNAASGACDDGNACTEGDKCEAGKCVYAELADCDDSSLCTDDSCDPVAGCVHTLNEVPCDDDDVCTTGDHCHLGTCINTGNLVCNDSNGCTDDSCNPATGCEFTPNQAGCDDGNECTENDTCSGGKCLPGTPGDCDDQNPCTKDVCDPIAGCVYTPADGLCNDGDECTSVDTCSQGECEPGPAVVCNDNNICTDDDCDPDSGCVFVPNDAQCDDLNACTDGDSCELANCVPGPALVCTDDNECTSDTCDTDTGCVYPPLDNGTPCGGPDDACIGGECVACGNIHGTKTFDYTGSAQQWQVPGCITQVHVVVSGAQGAQNGNNPPQAGALGGKAEGDLTVAPGATLSVYVGGTGNSGGWNGGGTNNGGYTGGQGGGASDVRVGGSSLNDRVIVGGGAGGHPGYSHGYGGWHGAAAGVGGGLTGEDGKPSDGNNPPAGGGKGGTQNSGGSQGNDGLSGGNYISGTAGTFGQGGKGGGEGNNPSACGGAGSGGGGWYGGGGGGHHNCGGGGGGGGSSYVGGVSNGSTQSGVRSGHGQVVVTW